MTFVTVHQLITLPFHNLNRDESGAPKTVTEGGVVRARLSSQSLKRAARVRFERDSHTASVRSREHVDTIVEDAVALLEAAGKKVTEKVRAGLVEDAMKRIASLTAGDGDGKRATLTWLSAGERGTLAMAVAGLGEFEVAPVTDSVAIAAFGRMFAASPHANVEAAVAVGHATTTHEAVTELDFYATLDDLTDSAGAAQLGYQLYTSGVYARAWTIDTAQLERNLGCAPSREDVELLVRALVLALPGGHKAGTAAQTLPAVVIAQVQAHPVHFAFHTPVRAAEGGGFLTASADALVSQVLAATAFDPELLGRGVITGTNPELAQALGYPLGGIDEVAKLIIEEAAW